MPRSCLLRRSCHSSCRDTVNVAPTRRVAYLDDSPYRPTTSPNVLQSVTPALRLPGALSSHEGCERNGRNHEDSRHKYTLEDDIRHGDRATFTRSAQSVRNRVDDEHTGPNCPKSQPASHYTPVGLILTQRGSEPLPPQHRQCCRDGHRHVPDNVQNVPTSL